MRHRGEINGLSGATADSTASARDRGAAGDPKRGCDHESRDVPMCEAMRKITPGINPVGTTLDISGEDCGVEFEGFTIPAGETHQFTLIETGWARNWTRKPPRIVGIERAMTAEIMIGGEWRG